MCMCICVYTLPAVVSSLSYHVGSGIELRVSDLAAVLLGG